MGSYFSEAELELLSDLVYEYRDSSDLTQREWAMTMVLSEKIDALLENRNE